MSTSESKETEFASGKDDTKCTPETCWYGFFSLKTRRFGNLWIHFPAGAAFLVISLWPLGEFIYLNYNIPPWLTEHPLAEVGWLLVVTLSYPVWSWLETRQFEKWVKKKADLDERKELIRQYTSDVALTANFWKAVWGVYTAASAVGVALKLHG